MTGIALSIMTYDKKTSEGYINGEQEKEKGRERNRERRRGERGEKRGERIESEKE